MRGRVFGFGNADVDRGPRFQHEKIADRCRVGETALLVGAGTVHTLLTFSSHFPGAVHKKFTIAAAQ